MIPFCIDFYGAGPDGKIGTFLIVPDGVKKIKEAIEAGRPITLTRGNESFYLHGARIIGIKAVLAGGPIAEEDFFAVS
ncbi:MAG: hypothetical protein KIS92_04880 [Planctomycetota bacterium]|nr:hypothetical protein [Planctomycetota bacterium]